MRFNILITFLFLTLASGLVVPPGSTQRTDAYARQLLPDDVVDIDVRSPSILTGLARVAPYAVGAARNAVKGVTNMVKGTGRGAKVPVGKSTVEAKKVGGPAKGAGKSVAAKPKGVVAIADKKVKGSPNNAGSGPHNRYIVPGGRGKLTKFYTENDVQKSVSDANVEKKALKAPGVSNRRRNRSDLQIFHNNKHRAPKLGHPGPNSLPKEKGRKLMEFPIRTQAERGAGRLPRSKDKGPARAIMEEGKDGKLKLKGVVAHDQSRAPGTPGYNDHFQIKGTQNRPVREH